MGTKNGPRAQDSDSDTDFQERDESEDEPESEEEGAEVVASDEMESDARRPRSMHSSMVSSPKNSGKLIPIGVTPNQLLTIAVPIFKRAQVPLMASGTQLPPQIPVLDGAKSPPATCPACENYHLPGRCPLKLAGVEYCTLCGIAHFGRGRICPHINSITQLQAMQEAVKHSTESAELKELAKKKLTGLIGSIRQKRRLEEEARAAALRTLSQPGPNFAPGQHAIMNRQVLPRQTNGGRVGKAH